MYGKLYHYAALIVSLFMIFLLTCNDIGMPTPPDQIPVNPDNFIVKLLVQANSSSIIQNTPTAIGIIFNFPQLVKEIKISFGDSIADTIVKSSRPSSDYPETLFVQCNYKDPGKKTVSATVLLTDGTSRSCKGSFEVLSGVYVVQFNSLPVTDTIFVNIPDTLNYSVVTEPSGRTINFSVTSTPKLDSNNLKIIPNDSNLEIVVNVPRADKYTINVKAKCGDTSIISTIELTAVEDTGESIWKRNKVELNVVEGATVQKGLNSLLTDSTLSGISYSPSKGEIVDNVWGWTVPWGSVDLDSVTIVAKRENVSYPLKILLHVGSGDETPPHITRITPALENNFVSSPTVTCKFSVVDKDAGIGSVVFMIGDAVLTDTSHVDSIYQCKVKNLKPGEKAVLNILVSDASMNHNTDSSYVNLTYDSTMQDNIPPELNIVSPSRDTVVGTDSCCLRVICQDESGISSVYAVLGAMSFNLSKSVDSLWTGTIKGLTPAQFSTVTLIATDSSKAKNNDSAKVRIKYDNDTTRPSIRLIDPTADSMSFNASSYTVKVACNDISGIASVLFALGTQTFKGACTTGDSIWSAAINGLPSDQVSEIIAAVTDSSLRANKNKLIIHIKNDPTQTDNVGPSFTKVSGPATGSSISNPSVSLVYTISDASGINNVSWTLNGNSKGNVTPAGGQYSISTILTSYHTNTIVIKATDNSTKRNIDSETVVLDYNVAPITKDTSITTNMNSSKGLTLSADPVDGDMLVSWSVGSPLHGTISGTAPSITYTPSTNFFGVDSFFFTVSDGKNVSNGAKVKVTVMDTRATPNIISGPSSPGALCAGAAVSFTVTASGTEPLTYEWKRGTTDVGTNSATLSISSISSADGGSYTVTITNDKGSITSDPVVLTVNTPVAPTNVGATKTTICPGEAVTLQATGSYLKWYSGGCGNGTALTSTTVYPSSTTTYYVRSEIGSCVSACGSVAITVNSVSPIPTNVSANPASVCYNNITTLSASGSNLKWYSGSCGGTLIGTGTSVTTSPLTATTTFYVRSEASGYCPSECVPVTISVNPGPIPTPTTTVPTNYSVREGAYVTLNASIPSPYTIEWRDYLGNVVGTGATLSFTASQDVTYTFRGAVPQTSCRGPSDSRKITVVPISKVTQITADPSDATVCKGGTINLSVPFEANMTYVWNINGTDITGAGNSLSFTDNPNNPNIDGEVIGLKICNSIGYCVDLPKVTLHELSLPLVPPALWNWGDAADHRWVQVDVDTSCAGYEYSFSNDGGTTWTDWIFQPYIQNWPNVGPVESEVDVQVRAISNNGCRSAIITGHADAGPFQ